MKAYTKTKIFVLLTILLFAFTNTVQANEITRSAWIPRWSPVSGFESVRQNADALDEISPMWYKVNDDGSLYSYEPSNKKELINFLEKEHIDLIPTVAMFDYNIIHEVFSTEEGFDRHIESILEVIQDNDYEGIDLDYESILLEDKEKFFEFLEILSRELKSNDKKLYVTVLAKWGDDIHYTLPQTRGVQDWHRISGYVDMIRIMAYDYTYTGSVHPGPIGPLSWHKRILEYAVSEVPKDKLQLGIHLYAYQWSRPKTSDFFNKDIPTLISERNFTTASSYVATGVERLLSENNGEFDTYEGENFFRYINSSDMDTVLVYPDRMSVLQREELAKEIGIKGVVFWSLGGDEDLLSETRVKALTENDTLVKSVINMLTSAL